MTLRALLVACASCALLLGGGCRKSGPMLPEGCPDAEAVSALHASAFYFQSGPAELGRARLGEALQQLKKAPTNDATTQAIRDGLELLARLPTSATDERARGAEVVRALLSEWRCLPESFHQRMHDALPPIPGTEPPQASVEGLRRTTVAAERAQ
jgi:hypothetical protein